MIQICLYYLGNPLTLSNDRVIEDFFSSIAFKSTIASNKQLKTKAQQLSLNRKCKSQGSPWALQEPLVCKTENSNAYPNKNEQGSHWGLLPYDNNGWRCELDETNTSIMGKYLQTLGPPFRTFTLTSNF